MRRGQSDVANFCARADQARATARDLQLAFSDTGGRLRRSRTTNAIIRAPRDG